MALSISLSDLLPYVVAVLVSLIGITYFYLKRKLAFWEKKGVPVVEKPSLFFGNIKEGAMQRMSFGDMFHRFYKQAEGHRFAGIYFLQKPSLIIRDPELIRSIMAKDFSHFQNHDTFVDEEVDPLQAKNLFALQGMRWRHTRIKLTPTFTSGKMKKMFQLVIDCAEVLKKYLENIAETGEPVEMKELLGRFTTDVIGTCAFGVEINSINEPESEFRTYGKQIFKPPDFLENAKLFFMVAFPKLSKMLKLTFTPQKVTNFFRKIVKDNIEYREKNSVLRNDFIDLLIKLKNLGKVEDDEEEVDVQNGHLSAVEDVDIGKLRYILIFFDVIK